MKVMAAVLALGLVLIAVPGPVQLFWFGCTLIAFVVGWLIRLAFDPYEWEEPGPRNWPRDGQERG